MFVGFRVSKAFAAVSQLPGALRLSQKTNKLKHTTGVLEYVACEIYHVHRFHRPPKPFAAVLQLPAALRLPEQKHAPRFLENRATAKQAIMPQIPKDPRSHQSFHKCGMWDLCGVISCHIRYRCSVHHSTLSESMYIYIYIYMYTNI